MANELALFQNLGIVNPANVNYSSLMDAFVGKGYTSTTGNTYFNAAHFAEGILIKEDVGQGYRHTFLNGLHIYDLYTKKLLCGRAFSRYEYSRENVKKAVKCMLENLLFTAADKDGICINQDEVRDCISKMIDQSFATNQVQMMNRQLKSLSC